MIYAASDLHLKFPELPENLTPNDLVLITGDLLDERSKLPILIQIEQVIKYFESLKNSPCIKIVCSGNHDCADGPFFNSAIYNEYKHLSFLHEYSCWLHYFKSKNFFTDNDIFFNDSYLITILPYRFVYEESYNLVFKEYEDLFISSSDLLSKRHKWIVLSHIPPVSPLSIYNSIDHGNIILNQLLTKYKPDYLLSGHLHSRANKTVNISSTNCIYLPNSFTPLDI